MIDFIEDDPFTIDLKITGVKKVSYIPIEKVGTYSFKTTACCEFKKEDLFKKGKHDKKQVMDINTQKSNTGIYQISKEINLIINIKTEGIKRQISIES